MSRNRFWLTHEQWTKIAPLLPTDVRGKARVDDRRVEFILAVYVYSIHTTPRAPSPTQTPGDPSEYGFQLYKIMPAPRPSRAPDYLPAMLSNFFLQAADSVKRSAWDAAGGMSRKTVDAATKDLMKEQAKQVRDLAPRIDALAAAGKLTEDLRVWAHQIRLDGNDAVHDINPFTKEEAEELLDFTELFLTYVYTLPGRLAAKKKPHAPPQS